MAVHIDRERPGEGENGEEGSRCHWSSGKTHRDVDYDHDERSTGDVQEDSKYSEQTSQGDHEKLIPVVREGEKEGKGGGELDLNQACRFTATALLLDHLLLFAQEKEMSATPINDQPHQDPM